MTTEAIGLITALVVLIGAFTGYLSKLQKNVSEIHVMVNSRMEEMTDWAAQLEEVLRDAGIVVPARPERTSDDND